MGWVRIGIVGSVCCLAWGQAQTELGLNDQGLAAAAAGRHDEARAFYAQSSGILRALGPERHGQLATVLINLGQTLTAQGERAAAVRAHEEGVYTPAGRASLVPAAAVRAHEEGVRLAKASFGPDHIRTLTGMNYLGSGYLMLGDPARAGAVFEDALPRLRERHPADPELARTLAGLASVRSSMGRNEEAASLMREALSLSIRVNGENSADTGLMYMNVAEIHRLAGETPRALPLYRKAIAIYEKTLGPRHIKAAEARGQQALALLQEGKPGMAERSLRESLEIVMETCPRCLVERWTLENNLALAYLTQGRFRRAEQLLTGTLALQERHSPVSGAHMAETLRSLAAIRQKERKFDEAERLNRRAAGIASFR